MVDFNRQPLDLGHVTASPAAVTALGDALRDLLARHAAGDWGNADAEVAAENFQALVTGSVWSRVTIRITATRL